MEHLGNRVCRLMQWSFYDTFDFLNFFVITGSGLFESGQSFEDL